jgi:hypothetical protein
MFKPFDHAAQRGLRLARIVRRSSVLPVVWRRRLTVGIALGFSILALSGCDSVNAGGTALDQSEVCVFGDFEAGAECRAGQLMFYRPQVWGNAQLPLVVIAVACDFRHPILHTEGGVVCVKSEAREAVER